MPGKVVYDNEDIMRMLDIGKHTLLRMVKMGTIPTMKMGGKRKYPVKQVHEWLARESQRKEQDATNTPD